MATEQWKNEMLMDGSGFVFFYDHILLCREVGWGRKTLPAKCEKKEEDI